MTALAGNRHRPMPVPARALRGYTQEDFDALLKLLERIQGKFLYEFVPE